MQQRDITLLTSSQLIESFKTCNGVIIPIASVEQCGTHGALGIDVHVAKYISEKLSDKCNMLFAPVIAYGDAFEMQDFKGTVNIPADILSSYYYAVALSFFKACANNVMFFASHSLNLRAADSACRRLYSEGYNAIIVDFWKACSQVSSDILKDKNFGTGHGAEQISSVSLAVNNSLIKKDAAVNESPKSVFYEKVKHIYGGSNFVTSYANFHDYSVSGSWGDISNASAEEGRKIIDLAIASITKEVLQLEKFNF